MPNSSFLDAQLQHENIGSFDLYGAFDSLKIALTTYSKNQSSTNERAVDTAFAPIAEYYSKLTGINSTLQTHINKASTNISSINSSEERYVNRIHPEESVVARESMYGFIPELRTRTLPYLLATSVFMALLSLFLIFQMLGFSGQLNLPLSITAWLSSPASPIPFYKNPLILGGVSIVLLVSLVIFAVLYFKAKNTNNK